VNGREYTLQDAGLVNIKRLPATADALQYAVRGSLIEFRGVPATDWTANMHYFGYPVPFDEDTDENSLLTDHEELYVAGGKYFLFLHTQDFELADKALDGFGLAVATLNAQVGRKLGGGATVGAYNLGNRSTGSSY
jgi:hypothetical protein